MRAELYFCLIVKELPGSDGKKTEIWRVGRMNPKFGKYLEFMSIVAAAKALTLMADPLIVLKSDVVRMLGEVGPFPKIASA